MHVRVVSSAMITKTKEKKYAENYPKKTHILRNMHTLFMFAFQTESEKDIRDTKETKKYRQRLKEMEWMSSTINNLNMFSKRNSFMAIYRKNLVVYDDYKKSRCNNNWNREKLVVFFFNLFSACTPNMQSSRHKEANKQTHEQKTKIKKRRKISHSQIIRTLWEHTIGL